jgi:hypothetical protein
MIADFTRIHFVDVGRSFARKALRPFIFIIVQDFVVQGFLDQERRVTAETSYKALWDAPSDFVFTSASGYEETPQEDDKERLDKAMTRKFWR